jgi:hypothetical protein
MTAGETITYQEIRAWADLTGAVLNGWESEALRTLSAAYAAEFQAARDPKRAAPYSPPHGQAKPSREEVQARLKAMFGIEDPVVAEPAPPAPRRPRR